MMKLQVSAIGNDAYLESLNVLLSGSIPIANIAKVFLFEDANNDGSFGTGDPEIGMAITGGGRSVLVPIDRQIVVGEDLLEIQL